MRINDTAISNAKISFSDLDIDFSSAVVFARKQSKGGKNRQVPLPGSREYENKLNALAVEMADGIDINKRTVLPLKGDVAEKFKTLINAELNAQRANDETPDLSKAIHEAKDALFERIGNALVNADHNASKGLDVLEGYWKRHGGEEDATALGNETWMANRDEADLAYDDTLNSLASDMADGIDTNDRTVHALTGANGEQFRQLVKHQLEQQHKRNEAPDLQTAIDKAKDDLFKRTGNALTNADKDSANGLDVLNGYWARHDGKDDAIDAGYAAFNDFLAENTLTDNPNYEDNLNALAAAMAGATLTDSRQILHLDSSDTLSQLYQNLIDSKLSDGASLEQATKEANNELRERIRSAAGDDGKAVQNVFDGYWSRHGGDNDAQRLAGNAEIDTARREHDLPPLSNVDIRSLETTEADPDDSSRNQTVSELTWKTLTDDWKTGIENGSIDKNDERAQFYRALRAQGALDNGLEMVGLDISEGLSLEQVNGDDFSSIIDREKLEESLGELFSSEAVQKDYMAAQSSAVGKVSDKEGIASRLEETAFSTEYIEYIKNLRESGRIELAEQDISSTYGSLAAMFPATEDNDKAAEFAQSLQIDSMVTDLDELIDNPDRINDANTATATQDVVKMVLTALKRAGVDIPRRTAESIDKFVNEYLKDQQTAKNFGKALEELGDKFQRNGSITQADIDGLMKNGVYKALNEKTNGGMLSLISTLNSNGALGSTGGLISLASGIYQLAGGKLADSDEARMAVAKEFISFLGASQHFVNLGSNTLDKIKGTHVNAMLGLDKTLPQIWGNDAKGSSRSFTDADGLRFVENVEKIIDDAPVDDQKRLSQQLDLSESDTKKIVEGAKNGIARNPALPGATTTTRAASSYLRVLDGAANGATGALDIALGGLMIKRGSDNGDGATIGQGAVTVAAGAFGLAGGGSALAALKGITVARAATGPLFWVSAGLTLATLPFSIMQDVKRTNALEGHESDLKELFNSLDQDGLLTEDGTSRYEFLEAYVKQYGQRDAPDDESIFEYRSDEYEFYVNEGHLPEANWDDFTHEDYAGDGDNLQTQMDRGSTVGA